ncbi:hypothetical protein [Halobacterium wangiae]|uniref:hypothetical protein n=1 Tax=Halobacterium wangiae TaxID=2902623 RepID=UPI001E424D28|nr:hypothetical protein [Halobacterium wangiae]
MASPVAATLLAGGLAAVHLLAGRLRFLQAIPRSRTLSLAGGASVAYVFVHLLPEVTERQAELAEGGETATALVAVDEHVLFLVALVGFATFYGLERLAVRSKSEVDRRAVAGERETQTPQDVFWVHISSFAVYNALVGYLLVHREESGTAALLLYFVAMALHFVVNDYGLRDHHQEAYTHRGRWILAGAVFSGLAVGLAVDVRDVVLGLLLAFLAGGVVLNVIKEELPEERESSFGAFVAGVAGYTVVLLLL